MRRRRSPGRPAHRHSAGLTKHEKRAVLVLRDLLGRAADDPSLAISEHATPGLRERLTGVFEAQMTDSANAGYADAREAGRKHRVAKSLSPGSTEMPIDYRFGGTFETIPATHSQAVAHTSHLITQLTIEEQNVIRDVIGRGFRIPEGKVYSDTARQLATRLRAELPELGHLGGLNLQQANALQRQVDAYLVAQLKTRTPEVARVRTLRYHRRLHRRKVHERAETIARTETMKASNTGFRMGVNGAVRDGLLHRDSRRRWSATGDERQCPICGRLHGTVTSLHESWPEGEPPAHPRCRCTFVILPPTAEAVEARRQAAEEAARADLLARFAARLRAAEEAKRRAAEKARRQAAAEAKRLAEERAKRLLARAAAARKEARRLAREAAAEEARRQAAEEAAKRRAAARAREAARREHAARRRARREAIEAKRRAEEEARRQALEDAQRRAAERVVDPLVAEAANWRAQDHPPFERIARWRGENTPGGLNRLAGVLRQHGINPKAANLAKRRKPLRAADRDLFGHQLADTLEALAERYPDAFKSLKEIELLRSNSRASADAASSMMNLAKKTEERFQRTQRAAQRRILTGATRPDDALWARIRINPHSDMWQFRTGRQRVGELQSGTRASGKGIHGAQYRFGPESPVSEIQAAIIHEFGHVRSFNAFTQWYVEDGRKALKRGDTRLADELPDFDSWTEHAERHVNEMLEQAIKRGEIDPPPEFTATDLKDLNKYLKKYRERQRRSPKEVPLWQRYAWGDVSQYGSMNIHEFLAETALDVGVFGQKAATVSRFMQRQVDEAQHRFTAELKAGENPPSRR